MKENTNIYSNTVVHVSPVALTVAWPPPWIGGEQPNEAVAVAEPIELLPVEDAIFFADHETEVVDADADDLPTWEDGEPWTDATPTCPKCGTAALWESMADKLHCMRCEPPVRSQRWAARAAVIRSRPQRLHKPVVDETSEDEGGDRW